MPRKSLASLADLLDRPQSKLEAWLGEKNAADDLGARLGGAPRAPATLRVVVWGALAMAVTAAIGALVGAVT